MSDARPWGQNLQIQRIVSGGQTGVDRAALDCALALGIACGGWCPRGRRAEDGSIPEQYPLVETPEDDYVVRTEWNVRDTDATLVLNRGALEGGTAHTVRLARAHLKPCFVVDLDEADTAAVREWLDRQGVRVLNVAGPRESKCPGIGAQTREFLQQVLRPSGRGRA